MVATGGSPSIVRLAWIDPRLLPAACQIQQTLALLGDECRHVDERRMNFALNFAFDFGAVSE
jgi:hypothetical protein